jgi:Carboxypeptidase regulatory-like domain
MRHDGFSIRTTGLCLGLVLLFFCCGLAWAQQQQQRGGATDATLKITVVDPNGAAVPLAQVSVKTAGGAEQKGRTSLEGEVTFTRLSRGTAQIDVEAAGFASRSLTDFTLGAGSNRAEVQLDVAVIKEDVQISRDEQERNTDPNGNAFSSVLGEEQIAALPDDPEEFENAVNQMAGPGATIRVNGFRGGRLPPKSQIREIRFRRNPFAAEFHERGFVSVDVYTKPGINSWHGSFGFGFRDEAFSARPVFAPRRGPEQMRRFNFTLDGPLWKNHTSLFLSADGTNGYDSKTLVAALPEGRFDDIALRPSRKLNFSARIEHALDKTHAVRFEYQRNAGRQDNLGVGDFELFDRAYTLDQAEHILRVSESGVFAKRYLNEARAQLRLTERENVALSDEPAVQVLNAFTRGGAQTGGSRNARELELADNLDFSFGAHSMRAGLLFELGSYRSDEMTNANGTFIFAGLDEFRAGRPTTFSRRTGDPSLSFSRYQFAWYWQDDFRVRKNLMLSFGLRQEFQSNLADRSNLAPRFGLTWSPDKAGTVTVRAGAGLFYDWFEAGTYEQTLRVNGLRQSDLVVRDPGFPDPFSAGTATLLPPGRIQSDPRMQMPSIAMASVGVEARLLNRFRLNADYRFERGTHLLRGRNINAPVPGFGRPDPTAGNIIQIESSASSTSHRMMMHLGPQTLNSKLFWMVLYMYSNTTSDTDGTLSSPADNYNLRAERGPAPNDMRHYFSGFLSRRLFGGISLGMNFSYSSALPYNITTGFDDNGDTVSNDRPAGVGRNSARGASRWDLGARLSWGFNFGGERKGEGGPQQVMVRVGPGGDGGGGFSPPTLSNQKYRMEFYAQAFNLFNHANLTNFTGVQTSPFFGQATAAQPGRRIETGVRFTF